ncbi:hypothetical protein [Pseudolactococcus carnosus]|uniref:hypothetical protein n=1 Tax=Pseudolactococcus carnosus TaxID=2749961 RepID=UPI001C4FF5E9|nr:hypothetical protein [Lactococcus carnosus]MCJ1972129.1 hypothetical protein [Lactococcus carnosus]
MFAKRKEKQVDAIKKFDALLTTAMGACDLIPEIEQILESHYKQFQKTQDVDRERARLCNALTPYAINRTLPKSTGELYLAFTQQHLTLDRIVRDQSLLTSLLMGMTSIR